MGLRRFSRASVVIGITASLVAVLFVAFHYVAPRPLLYRAPGYSQLVFNDDGKLLRLSLASDERYRVPVTIDQIPQPFIDLVLFQEDQYFFYHPGVNPLSLLRAAFQNLFDNARRPLGASTITMQLVRLNFRLNSKSYLGKLKQIAYAVWMEIFYSKKEILEAYLNAAPFGGNVDGVGAASWIYFGHDISRISVPEGITLAVIPQSPTRRRPRGDETDNDKHQSDQHQRDENDGGLQARLRLLDRAVLSTTASKEELGRLLKLQRINHRGNLPRTEAAHLVERALAENPFAKEIHLTVSSKHQRLLEERLRAYIAVKESYGINNAAILLADVRTDSVVGYVGSANFATVAIQGQVDGVRGKRSPGSALKPFIYGLALDQGLIHPESLLIDSPLSFVGYSPENFERNFLGPLTATDSLVRSRNVPAIALSGRLLSPSLYGLLTQAGVKNLKSEAHYGLALALGGVEVSLEELVKLYMMLARHGELRQLRYMQGANGGEDSPLRLLTPEAAYLTLEMLRFNPRPFLDGEQVALGQRGKVPWKTGTSFGFRDAWSLGVVGPYVLGVWVGNFNGQANPNFIGRSAAGELFWNVVDALAAGEPNLFYALPQVRPAAVREVEVCALTGSLPTSHCPHRKRTLFIAGKSPIKPCSVHRQVLVDPRTKRLACPGVVGQPEVYEYWSSDAMRSFKLAGQSKRSPPTINPVCVKQEERQSPVIISSPAKGTVYSLAAGEISVPLTVSADAQNNAVFWFVDETPLGTAPPGEVMTWKVSTPGEYLISAVDESGRANATTVRVVSQ